MKQVTCADQMGGGEEEEEEEEEAKVQVHVLIESALHLPSLGLDQRGLSCPPSCFVAFDSGGHHRVHHQTRLHSNTSAPRWHQLFTVDLRQALFYQKDLPLVFQVLHQPATTSVGDGASPILVGCVYVDLTPLVYGLQQLCGWYHVTESHASTQCKNRGQLKVTVTPLEHLTVQRSIPLTEDSVAPPVQRSISLIEDCVLLADSGPVTKLAERYDEEEETVVQGHVLNNTVLLGRRQHLDVPQQRDNLHTQDNGPGMTGLLSTKGDMGTVPGDTHSTLEGETEEKHSVAMSLDDLQRLRRRVHSDLAELTARLAGRLSHIQPNSEGQPAKQLSRIERPPRQASPVINEAEISEPVISEAAFSEAASPVDAVTDESNTSFCMFPDKVCVGNSVMESSLHPCHSAHLPYSTRSSLTDVSSVEDELFSKSSLSLGSLGSPTVEEENIISHPQTVDPLPPHLSHEIPGYHAATAEWLESPRSRSEFRPASPPSSDAESDFSSATINTSLASQLLEGTPHYGGGLRTPYAQPDDCLSLLSDSEVEFHQGHAAIRTQPNVHHRTERPVRDLHGQEESTQARREHGVLSDLLPAPAGQGLDIEGFPSSLLISSQSLSRPRLLPNFFLPPSSLAESMRALRAPRSSLTTSSDLLSLTTHTSSPVTQHSGRSSVSSAAVRRSRLHNLPLSVSHAEAQRLSRIFTSRPN